MEKNIVIIGAGPTGLGAALRLHQLGHRKWTVLEASPEAGGLASTVTDSNGFLWDIGVHVLFSHYKYFDDVLDAAIPLWNYLQRSSWVWMKERFIPYPFQNNVHRLPPEDTLRCIRGALAAEKARLPATRPRTFQDWIDTNFGAGIAELFLNPYNFKTWGCKPEAMTAEWMGERVPVVDVSRVVENILFDRDDVSWGPNAQFRYPARGGTGAIWRSVCGLLPQNRVRCDTEAVEIDCERRVVTTATGEEIPYDCILSTMPLDVLLRRLRGPQLDRLTAAAGKFVHSSVHIVGLGMEGQMPDALQGKSWLYFPEDNCSFNRVTPFSLYSPHNVPKPGQQWSLLFETCESSQRPPADDPVQVTIDGARSTGLIGDEHTIVSRFHTRLEYGYPTPFLGRNEVLDSVQSELMQRGIYSRGRFGGWKYEVANQDHSFMQGVEAVDNMLFGVEEQTYFYPDHVNVRKETTRRFTMPAETV